MFNVKFLGSYDYLPEENKSRKWAVKLSSFRLINHKNNNKKTQINAYICIIACSILSLFIDAYPPTH